MPRLLILSQYFPPEMGAPQSRLSELGERLIDLGWEVDALTALPNYPTGRVFPDYRPLRAVREHVGRIDTLRVPLFASKGGFTGRVASYLSFAASAALVAPARARRPDLILAESPPLFIGLAARHLARRWRCPFVFNVSDLWPESAIRMGVVKPGVATRMAERLELSIYRRSAGVTGQSQEIIDSIRRRAPGVPTAVITNGVDPDRFSPGKADAGARALLGDEPGPIFLYAGLLGWAQGLDQLLDVAAALPADVPGRFVLLGEGADRERLQARLAREPNHRVRIVAAQPRERIPAILAGADVAAITLGMTLPGAVPSKIYEAMASALPILLIADGEAARRVTDPGCGIAVRPGDVPSAVAAFVKLSTDAELRRRLGEAGRRAAQTTYHRDAIARTLDDFLRGRLASELPSPSSELADIPR